MFKYFLQALTVTRRRAAIGLIGLAVCAYTPPALAQADETPQTEQSQKAQGQTEQDKSPSPIEHVFSESPDDHVLGADDAPNTLIAYASVTCSHCGSWFSEQWPAVKSELVETGRLRFIFREFPTPPANMAMAGFFIANCAAQKDGQSSSDHDAFFKAIEYQMENQDMVFQAIKDGTVQETYANIAKKFGMSDFSALNQCFSNEDHYRQIDRSVACLLYTSPSPRDLSTSRMPSSA